MVIDVASKNESRHLFHSAHYNIIAKQIRELYPTNVFKDPVALGRRRILEDLAVNLAKRFAIDNDRFDPIFFLDSCSPNADSAHPLSELWEEGGS